jgi:dihydrolipoamide dehydrogenase
MDSYQVVVIGSGPGGYVAAIRAAQLGFKTACIEKFERLGGTCLNVGCIPSKALLYTTEMYHFFKHKGESQGLKADKLDFDFEKIMARKSEVVQGLTSGIDSLFKKNKVDWIKGDASFTSPKTLKVGEREIQADNIIIATGSEASALPFLPFDEERIVSSTGALSLKQVPQKMIVIGGGVIGVEMASVYNRLGSQVTVVEMLDEIVAGMDKTISRQLLLSLTKQGIVFHLGAKVLEKTEKGIKVQLNEGLQELEADVILVAVGRRPFTKNLNLEKAQLSTNSFRQIPVNRNFQTSQPHIYAIGDIIDGPMLAHKAMEEGTAAAEIIAGLKPHINYLAIPNVVYTSPEAVSIGFTEQETKDRKMEVLIGNCSYKAISRARCIGESEGFVKVIAEKNTKRLIGYHILGAMASEMAAEGALAIERKVTLEEIAATSHAHPTLAEGVKEAVLNALGRQIHF